jgi:hypothetical protein
LFFPRDRVEIESTDGFSSPFTALRVGRKIVYDGTNMRVTNDPSANEFLTRERRPP